MSTRVREMRGMSLVELMVALTIGLIILAAVSTVFVNSKTNYTTQESLARLQENARFALHFLTRDLRMAGYFGCAGEIDTINSILNDTSTGEYDFSRPIEAVVGNVLYPSNVTVPFPASGDPVTSKDPDCGNFVGAKCAGTSGFAVRMADASNAVGLQKTMPNTAAAAFIDKDSGLAVGDIVMLSDCASADIFQITNINTGNAGGSEKDTLVHNSGGGDPGNSTQRLSRVYEEGEAQLMKFVHRVYYIGTGRGGDPALFRMGINGLNREELVEGIEDLQLRFGVRTASDGTPRAYLPPDDVNLGIDPAKWANVVSARVTLTVRPIIDTQTSTPVYPNEVLAKEFVSTVLMRNLQ